VNVDANMLRLLALEVDAFEILAYGIYKKYNAELFNVIAHLGEEREFERSAWHQWVEKLFRLAERIVAERDENVILLRRDVASTRLIFALPVLLCEERSLTHILLAVARCEGVEDAKARRDRMARLARMR
jgi:hypothetical protein